MKKESALRPCLRALASLRLPKTAAPSLCTLLNDTINMEPRHAPGPSLVPIHSFRFRLRHFRCLPGEDVQGFSAQSGALSVHLRRAGLWICWSLHVKALSPRAWMAGRPSVPGSQRTLPVDKARWWICWNLHVKALSLRAGRAGRPSVPGSQRTVPVDKARWWNSQYSRGH